MKALEAAPKTGGKTQLLTQYGLLSSDIASTSSVDNREVQQEAVAEAQAEQMVSCWAEEWWKDACLE